MTFLRKSIILKYRDNDDTLTDWLHFLCTENTDDAEALYQTYPWLTKLYPEMAKYRQNPKVLSMFYFSEALRELDRNTIANMIKEQMVEIEEQKEEIEEQKKEIAEQGKEIKRLKKRIKEQDVLLAKMDEILAEKDALLAKKKKAALLAEMDAEIARLREELSKKK